MTIRAARRALSTVVLVRAVFVLVISLHHRHDVRDDVRNARDLHGSDGNDHAHCEEKDPHETPCTGWPLTGTFRRGSLGRTPQRREEENAANQTRCSLDEPRESATPRHIRRRSSHRGRFRLAHGASLIIDGRDRLYEPPHGLSSDSKSTASNWSARHGGAYCLFLLANEGFREPWRVRRGAT